MPTISQRVDHIRPIQPNRFLSDGGRPFVATDMTLRKLWAIPSRQRWWNSLSNLRSKIVGAMVARMMMPSTEA